jgi:hypothetical protein
MKMCEEKKKKAELALITSLFVLATLISLSNIQGCCIQLGYGAQEEGTRTLQIKAYLGKSAVEQGTPQTINFQVADQKSHQPIGGAITSTTVKYADGRTVRQFSVPTDPSGHSSISWRIEHNAPSGRYDVVYSVSETGYVSESFEGSFNVVAQSTNDTNYYQYYHPPSSSSLLSDPSRLVLDVPLNFLS